MATPVRTMTRQDKDKIASVAVTLRPDWNYDSVRMTLDSASLSTRDPQVVLNATIRIANLPRSEFDDILSPGAHWDTGTGETLKPGVTARTGHRDAPRPRRPLSSPGAYVFADDACIHGEREDKCPRCRATFIGKPSWFNAMVEEARDEALKQTVEQGTYPWDHVGEAGRKYAHATADYAE